MPVHPAGKSQPAISARRLCWGVFLLTLAVYALSADGHLLGQDQEYYYRMARAVVLDHTFAIEPPFPSGAGPAGAPGSEPRISAQYPPGLPLALTPAVLVGRSLAGPVEDLRRRYVWPYDDSADLGARFLVSYFNAPVLAATAALLALFVLRLGYSVRAAAFVAFAFAFATPAWGQARVVFPDPLLGLLLLVTCLFLLRCTRSGALIGGVWLALAMLVKLPSVFALPGLLLLPDSHGQSLWRTPRLAALLLGPVAGGGVASVLYNLFRFRSGLVAGFTELIPRGLELANPVVGLYGLVLSSGKGILWFAPPVLAAVFAYRRFRARRPVEARALALVAGLWLLSYSVLSTGLVGWDGGWGWGPRYLLPVLPFALVPLAEWWELPRARAVVSGLALAGVAVQVPGATVDFMEAGAQAAVTLGRHCHGCDTLIYATWRDYVPAGSDLATHTVMLLSGKLDLAWITFGDTWLAPTTLLLVAGIATAALATLWGPLRPTRSRPRPSQPPTQPGWWRRVPPKTAARSSWTRRG